MPGGKGSGEESLREITDQELAQLDEAIVAAWHAGTLREFFTERHPEWSDEEIKRWTVRAEAYFGAKMN
jgi:ribosome-binding ATPase YchF (GTP1/OBG family)